MIKRERKRSSPVAQWVEYPVDWVISVVWVQSLAGNFHMAQTQPEKKKKEKKRQRDEKTKSGMIKFNRNKS